MVVGIGTHFLASGALLLERPRCSLDCSNAKPDGENGDDVVVCNPPELR